MTKTFRPQHAFATPPSFARSLSAHRDATLFSHRVPDARLLDSASFSASVARAYRSLASRAERAGRPHLVRMWNGVPGIHDRVDDVQDRYMAFNAGRLRAMRGWYGDALVDRAPAASGVGIDGDDLVIHALAMATPGRAIQNPRQVPAALYSPRYGLLPPCFARATIVDASAGPTLFVSGTAAIVGEASMHADDLDAQLALTLDNLRTVVVASGLKTYDDPLGAFTSLRVYVPPSTTDRSDAGDGRVTPARLSMAFPNAGPIEFVRAQLCRRELLVEIEGVAAGL